MGQFSLIWLPHIDLIANESIGTHAKKLAQLAQERFPIPPGFVITSEAYFTFLKENKLDHKVRQLLSTIAVERPESLMQGEAHIKRLFEDASLSKTFEKEITAMYRELGDEVVIETHTTGPLSVKHLRLFAEDKRQFLQAIKDAWAVMFTAQALWQRHHQGVDHFATGASLIVQKNVRTERSGKVYTIDPQTHSKEHLVIVVEKPHAGDTYVLSKRTSTIIDRKLKHTTNDPKLTHDELLEIAHWAHELEKHQYFPQEITWAFADRQLFLLHTQPLMTEPVKPPEKKRKIPVARGKGITMTIGTGKIHLLPKKETRIDPHTIIIIDELLPIHVRQFRTAKAIIAEKGHQHTEAATLLRKLGIPTIINVKDATKHFRSGQVVTVHAGKGEIYLGGFH